MFVQISAEQSSLDDCNDNIDNDDDDDDDNGTDEFHLVDSDADDEFECDCPVCLMQQQHISGTNSVMISSNVYFYTLVFKLVCEAGLDSHAAMTC